MDTLYNQTNKLIQQTQASFQLLEGSGQNVVDIEADIHQKLEVINRYTCSICKLKIN